jgi:peptidoglycan/xylan/chitin deacetylase (PgdA/CDA1 family)
VWVSDVDTVQREYVLRWASAVVGFDCANWLDDEAISSIFYEVSRTEEVLNSVRDSWGNWDWQYGAAQRKGLTYIPYVDQLLQSAAGGQKPGHSGRPLWPGGKKFALVLTHDVDVVSESAISMQALRQFAAREISKPDRIYRKVLSLSGTSARFTSQILRSRVDDPLWHYEDWLKLEQKYGFKSTFYFFPSPLKNPAQWDCIYQFSDIVRFNGKRITVGEMMRSIRQAGWEIGLHGSYHSALDGEALKREKTRIEDVLGSRVTSVRQHYLHYDARTTPKLHAAAGFNSDSTQGFNRSIGFRAGTSFPYWCWDHTHHKCLPTLEIPMHIMDGGLLTATALEYDEDLAIRHAMQLMDAVEKVGGCLTLNWHPDKLNRPCYWNTYKRILDEAAGRGAWGCGAEALSHWWRERRDSIGRSQRISSSPASVAL